MHSAAFSTIRTIIVLMFVLAPPLIALPSVSATLGAWWNWRPVSTVEEEPELDSGWIAHSPVEGGLPSDSDAFSPNPHPISVVELGRPRQPPSVTSSDEPLNVLCRQLHDLGAVSTKLESTGAGNPRYRFCCQIPIKDSVYTRTFEDTHDDPFVAMQRVLAQVESWRLASSPPELTSATVR